MEIEDVRKQKRIISFDRFPTTVVLSKEDKVFLDTNGISVSLLVRHAIDELRKNMEVKV